MVSTHFLTPYTSEIPTLDSETHLQHPTIDEQVESLTESLKALQTISVRVLFSKCYKCIFIFYLFSTFSYLFLYLYYHSFVMLMLMLLSNSMYSFLFLYFWSNFIYLLSFHYLSIAFPKVWSDILFLLFLVTSCLFFSFITFYYLFYSLNIRPYQTLRAAQVLPLIDTFFVPHSLSIVV